MELPTTPTERPAPRARPRLRLPDGSERAIDAPVWMGSSTSCSVVVADATVSRVHAELEPRDDGLWIRDLASTNGVVVNGVRVARALLSEGAAVTLGAFTFHVVYEKTARSALPLWPFEAFGPMIGRAEVMRELFAILARAASTESAVLVLGETGTGKELVARALHEASARAAGPLVTVDCGALPETLLESELFGHARGAFTGAVAAREGAFEAAEGGTLFLDEIGELPLAMQPKLLRALESRSVRRIGESQYRPIDVRFVAATHCDIGRMVAAGSFREDLYFRLAVLPVRVPPLRERRQDIPLLLERFLGGPPAARFGAEGMTTLLGLSWRGNVRELRNFAERTLAFGPEMALEGAQALSAPRAAPPMEVAVALPAQPSPAIPPPSPATESYGDFRERWIAEGEAAYVKRLLALHDGNVAKAASAAKIARGYLYRLMKRGAIG